MTGPGWQPRRFDPHDLDAATAIVIAEGEKDAAYSALAGFVAYAMPGGSTRAESADWSIVAHAAHALGLPVVMAGDNDDVGRKARQAAHRRPGPLRRQGTGVIPGRFSDPGGSPVDLPDFADAGKRTDKRRRIPGSGPGGPDTPEFRCPSAIRLEHQTAGGQPVFRLVPCSNGNCVPCEAWATPNCISYG